MLGVRPNIFSWKGSIIMKKVNLVLTLAALSTMGAVLSGCNSQDVIKIGILQPVEHEAL